MKKVIWIIIVLIVVIGLIVGILYFNSIENESIDNNRLIQETTQNIINDNTVNVDESHNSQDGGEVSMENARIKLTVNGNEIFVKLYDNIASKDFLEMLPLKMTFEDFNNTEKIATLPNELSTEGLPSGYTPEVGDFAYYAPWGNISIFYKNFRYSNSLYKLGKIESGAEIFENMSGDFEVTIEKVD